MAGAAWTSTPPLLTKPQKVRGGYPIKSGEIINQGDLVGLDTNGQVVAASKTGGSTVKAIGIAFFDDDNSTAQAARTGVANLTVKCGICQQAGLKFSSAYAATQVPSINKGLPVYLGDVATGTVSNLTCAQTTTDTDLVQEVGHVDADGLTLLLNVVLNNDFAYQNAANSTARFV